MATRRIVYARINRRTLDQALFAERSFSDDMHVLASAGSFSATYGENEWFATDLAIDASDTFMSGVLGFMSVESFRLLDTEQPSWKKAPTTVIEGASRETLTAFAIDLREDRRWLAFAPTRRMTEKRFPLGFKVLLERAVTTHSLMPAEWDIDLIPSLQKIFEWLHENQDVREFRRVVKLANPGLTLEGDIEKLRQMGGRIKYEKYTPFYGGALQLAGVPDLVEELIRGSEDGNVEITITTRSGRSTYRSVREIEEGQVDDWGDDWDLGTDRMLDAVRQWSEGRPQQATLDGDPP